MRAASGAEEGTAKERAEVRHGAAAAPRACPAAPPRDGEVANIAEIDFLAEGAPCPLCFDDEGPAVQLRLNCCDKRLCVACTRGLARSKPCCPFCRRSYRSSALRSAADLGSF